jgi:integrase/recombinase XerD
VGGVRALTKDAIARYLDATRPATTPFVYGKVCALLGLFLRYLVAEEYIPTIPVRIVRPKRMHPEVRTFTLSEVLRLRDVVQKENARDFAIFMLLADTGVRASELCGLILSDFRWERREVIIRPQIAKNRSARIVPLCASLNALQRYRRIRGDDVSETDRFFLAYYATPVYAGGHRREKRRNTGSHIFCRSGLTRVGLYQLVRKWGRLAGLTESRCSPHTFRHFFATGYLREGGNIVSLQRILGHSRLDVTERYLRVAQDDIKIEHERFSPAQTLLSNTRHRGRPVKGTDLAKG